ncbi:hypothetical protein POF51_29540 [Brevibacillus sp. AG]|uniref:hypothetical protein n=1 Tax=Brevibacillus sp. AG TaxID=3020891 RepID=UPI00232AFB15|nr:hypothetical protein [Brevibacillus sp. AG]MDC0764868.1 hypothetical protein [Brevibacillus sp. AG]
MCQIREYKFTVAYNESKAVSKDDQNSFSWAFFESTGSDHDILPAGEIEGAMVAFKSKYTKQIKMTFDSTLNEDGTKGVLIICNKFDGKYVVFSIEQMN